MADLTLLREDMEIVGSDGGHVGVIDHVLDGELQLNRRDPEAEAENGPAHAHHHFIPIDWVDNVDAGANRATLNLGKDEAERRWRHG